MLSPAWELPQEAPQKPGTDTLVRKIGIAAAVCFALALILYVTYRLILGSGLSGLGDLAGKL